MWPKGKKFRKQKDWNYINTKTLNAPIAETEKQTRKASAPGMATMIVAGVPQERIVRRERFIIRLVSGGAGGVYGWQGVYEDPDHIGQFKDYPADLPGTSGTVDNDPAFEINKASTILTIGKTYVEAERSYVTNSVIFQLNPCS